MPDKDRSALGATGATRDPFHSRDAPDAIQPQHPRDPGTAVARPSDAPRTPGLVVGIDGSAESRSALQWAVGHGQRTGTPVHAVAVWQQPLQFGVSAQMPVPMEDFEAEARGWLGDALPALAAGERGAEVHTHLEQGDPAQQLLEHSQDAELLVLGNHGRGAVAGALLGSVTQHCAQRAPCPVVLVPTAQSAPEAEPRAGPTT